MRRRSEIGYRSRGRRSEYTSRRGRGRRSEMRSRGTSYRHGSPGSRRGVPGSHYPYYPYEPEYRRGRRGRGTRSMVGRILNMIHRELEQDDEDQDDVVEYKKYTVEEPTPDIHFTEIEAEEAVNKMKNEDGTTGPKWTLEETTQAAQEMGIQFDEFNKYDWYYTLNLMYSDYYNLFGTNIQSYITLANTFLNDKDGPSGKAYLYYKHVACAEENK